MDGRRPSIGFGRGGPYVRGYRSKPGAPMHDPTTNVPMSRDNRTPQSDWDRTFRNTASNAFGAAGENTDYISSFPAPVAPTAPPSTTDRLGYEPGGMAQLQYLASGEMGHAQQWSQPKPKVSFGWNFASPQETKSIFDRYRSDKPVARSPFGWGSAFANG